MTIYPPTPASHRALWKVHKVAQVLWSFEPSRQTFCGKYHHGSNKVPAKLPRFFKFPPLLRSFGAAPSWVTKVSRKYHQGAAKVLQIFFKLSIFSAKLRLGLPQGSAKGSTQVSSRFHKSSVKIAPGFPQVPPRFHPGSSS